MYALRLKSLPVVYWQKAELQREADILRFAHERTWYQD